MLSNRDLLQRIEHFLSQDDPDAAVRLQLASHKEQFLNLLQFPANNAEARQQVQSRTVNTLSRGPLQLDEDPDVKLSLLLSDELKLDEVFCVELLLQSHQERGDLSAETAAGIYFEERRALLASLNRLLQFHALELDDPALDEGLAADTSAVFSLNNELLSSKNSSEQSTLITRIVELIKDVSLEGGTGLKYVRDNTGELAPRNALVHRERSQLCELLMYAVFIAKAGPGVGVQDVVQLAELMHYLALKLSNLQGMPTAANVEQRAELFTAQQHVIMAEAALLISISPAVTPLSEVQKEAERTALSSLAANSQVAAALHLSETTGFHHVAALAWGVLQLEHGTDQGAGRKAVRKAMASGSLRFLADGILASVPLKDDDAQTRELIARLSMSLLLRIFVVEEDLIYKDLVTGRVQQVAETSGISASISAPGATAAPSGDGIYSLLKVLELVLQIRPELALEADLRDEKLEIFLESVPHGGCMQTAKVLSEYLRVLKALCAGEMGARMVFHQLMHPHMPDQLSWGKLFTVMLKYCHWFQPPEGESEEPGGVRGQSAGEGRFMSEEDMEGLVAYLELFAAVLENGQREEVISWVRQLEDKMSLRPLHEVLFQLMCHRVPHQLKAQLTNTIAVFASSAESAAELWERLKATAIFEATPEPTPGSLKNIASVAMRYDLSYQLAEIEERAELYPEVLAFVCLLNRLLDASKGQLADNGRPYAHYTHFICSVILGQLGARAYKMPEEKWELAEAGLLYLRAVMEATKGVGDKTALVAADASGSRAPGVEALLSILKDSRCMKTVLGAATTGVDQLVKERGGSEHGAALESAVVAALQVLVTALEVEEDLLGPLLAARAIERDTSLVALLRADARRLASITDYVRYPFSIEIQIESLRLLKLLSARLPNLLDLLARGSGIPVHRLNELQRMRAVHTAAALDASLFRGPDVSEAPQDQAGDQPAEDEDPRAALILELLLDSAELPGPNLAQLLLGFPLDGDSGMLDPQQSVLHYSCLTIILKAAADDNLPRRRPRLYEQVMELIYLLAANMQTRYAMLHVLRSPRCGMLMSQLDAVACAPLPASPAARVASLHARAWLLQLAALELHVVDPEVASQADSATHILSELFDPAAANHPQQGPGFLMEQRRSRILEILELGLFPLDEPRSTCDGEGRRMQEEMQLQELIMSTATVAEGGVRCLSPRGTPIIDIPTFIAKVMERYKRVAGMYTNSGRSGDEALKAACRESVSYAHARNEFQEESIAQYSLMTSWHELVEVAFSRRYALLGSPVRQPRQDAQESGPLAMVLSSADGPSAGEASKTSAKPSEMLHDALRASLMALDHMLSSGMDRMAPLLCSAVQTLLSRVQEEGTKNGAGSPRQAGFLPTSWLPSRCHEILMQLLGLLQKARRNEGVRSGLYGALLCYLQICKGPRVREWPQAVVDALLDRSLRAQNVAAIDHSQAELEHGNAKHLQAHAARLVQVLSADALGGRENLRALVFRLLSELVAVDPQVANEIHATDLPRNILDSLSQSTAAALALPARQSQAACIIIEGQLGLLQALCLAGPAHDRSATAQRVDSIGALRCLVGCRPLGTQVEELGGSSGRSAMSLRSRLGRIIRPVLRLLSCITSSLSISANVTTEALEFVGVHHRLLSRILSEAARGGEVELEQGCLVAGIMARLAPHMVRTHGDMRYKAQMLDERMWELCRMFLNQDADTSNPESDLHNPVMAAIAQAKRQIVSLLGQRDSLGLHERQTNIVQVQQLQAQLEVSLHSCRSLRCSLLRYVHKVVLHVGNGGSWTLSGQEGDADMSESSVVVDPFSTATRRPQMLPGSSRILLVVNCFTQAVMDMHEVLGERLRLLDFLRSAFPGDDRVHEVLEEYGMQFTGQLAVSMPDPKRLELAKSAAGGMVATCERTIKQLLYLCELAVALILGEAQHRVLATCDKDLQRVASRVKHPFAMLGQIQPEHLPERSDTSHLTLLIRQTKKFLSNHD